MGLCVILVWSPNHSHRKCKPLSIANRKTAPPRKSCWLLSKLGNISAWNPGVYQPPWWCTCRLCAVVKILCFKYYRKSLPKSLSSSTQPNLLSLFSSSFQRLILDEGWDIWKHTECKASDRCLVWAEGVVTQFLEILPFVPPTTTISTLSYFCFIPYHLSPVLFIFTQLNESYMFILLPYTAWTWSKVSTTVVYKYPSWGNWHCRFLVWHPWARPKNYGDFCDFCTITAFVTYT